MGGTTPRALTIGATPVAIQPVSGRCSFAPVGPTTLGTTPISVILQQAGNRNTATTSVNFYGQITANQPTVPTTGKRQAQHTRRP